MFKIWIKTRGLPYLEYASDIWQKRNRKLIDRWCILRSKDKTFEEFQYFQRLQEISFNLEDTIKMLHDAYHEERDKQRADRHKLDYTMLILRCNHCYFKIMHTISPHWIACSQVLFKDYTPGEILCKECGNPMTTSDEDQMERELRQMRIRI